MSSRSFISRVAPIPFHRLPGKTMSPTMCAVPASEPSLRLTSAGREAGTISAMGCPRLVMRTGRPVRRTSSRTARQVALNSDIAIDTTNECTGDCHYGYFIRPPTLRPQPPVGWLRAQSSARADSGHAGHAQPRDAEPNAVDTRQSCDVEGASVFVAPSKVVRGLRQPQRPEVTSCCRQDSDQSDR